MILYRNFASKSDLALALRDVSLGGDCVDADGAHPGTC